jgi:DNA modification methylase
VLVPYSDRMKLLLKNSDKYYSPKKRPSGHDISARFAEDRGGAIPPNLLQIPNTESNSQYLRYCKLAGTKGHPARFPQQLPEFFIQFLTDHGDTVLDIFAGSNTTGAAAEGLGRQWLAFEMEQSYLAASAFRFLPDSDESAVQKLHAELCTEGAANVAICQVLQPCLLDEKAEYATDEPV